MTKLETLRLAIDQTDKELVRLLEERFKLVREIGHYKKENNLPIFDPEREKFVLATKEKLVQKKEDWPYYERIFKLFMDISKEMEK
ncbi:chorismate mutase [Acholeplasma equirhinis]|uniref:chorismate mutase n=1 Tax=Acholeplasma equirhinis TaxID=555393 RepID=UPI00197AB933|nr:chorismate mutase [Acholeplasma equirhinis]MBN3490831.1 chorismate mutase [Acholeplasma equirhinis]